MRGGAEAWCDEGPEGGPLPSRRRGGAGARTSPRGGPQKQDVVGGGGGRVRGVRGSGRAQEDSAVAERHEAAVVQRHLGQGPGAGYGEPEAGETVSLGVEGGEVTVGTGVVLGWEPGLLHAEGGCEEGCPVRDGEGGCGEGGCGGRAPGEVAQPGGGGVGGEEGHAGPAANGKHACDLGYPLGVGGVARESVEAEPTAVEHAEVGVPEQEARAKACALLVAVACDDHEGE